MTRYRYDAVDADGTTVHGHVEASTPADVHDRLRATAMLPLRIESVTTARVAPRSVPLPDVALGLRLLADLLDSGIPMQQALTLFGGLSPKTWRGAIPHLRSRVREGSSLAEALEDAPVALPSVVLGMLHVGEAGPGLATAVRRASDFAEHEAQVRAATRSALAYPAVVAVTGLLSLSLMIGVVLPRFATMLADLGQQLPRSTQLLLRLGSITRASLTWAPIGVVAVAWLVGRWVVTPTGQRQLSRILWRLPVLGAARQGALTARVTSTLAALLAAGVPIARALGLAAQAGGEPSTQVAFGSAIDRIREGASLSAALRFEQVLTENAIRLVEVGERTGRLPELLEHAARLERDRSARLLATLVRLLEPSLILGLAISVGLVAIALLQAIYAVRPT